MKQTARALAALLLVAGLVLCCACGTAAANRIKSEASLLKLLAAYRVSGMEAFDFSLTKEYFDEVSADDFALLPVIAAKAGMTDYRLKYVTNGDLFFEEVSWAEPFFAQCDDASRAEDAVREMVARRAEHFSLICSPEAFDRLMDEDGKSTGLEDALVHAGIFQCGISYSPGARIISIEVTAVYPGTRILQAVEAGDDSFLTAREKETLAAAQRLAEDCRREDGLSTARAIHDALCETVVYTDDRTTEEDDTAIGALLNGQANCDGYADAFLLAGTLAGLKVRYQHGDSYRQEQDDRYEGVTHLWNLLEIDGSWRLVDVTWDDQGDRTVHIWFNIGLDRARLMHVWNEEMSVPLLEETVVAERPENEYLVRSLIEAQGAVKNAMREKYPSFVLVLAGKANREEVLDMMRRVVRGSISYSWNEYMKTLSVIFLR